MRERESFREGVGAVRGSHPFWGEPLTRRVTDEFIASRRGNLVSTFPYIQSFIFFFPRVAQIYRGGLKSGP